MGALSDYGGLVKVHLLLVRWAAEAKQKSTDGVGVSEALTPSVGVAPSQEHGTGIIARLPISSTNRESV